MEEIVVEIKNASKSFLIDNERRNTIFEILTKKKTRGKKIKILDNVSLTIKKGETVGIVGLNGVGKTTFLKLLSNIYKLDSGNIIIKGKVIPLLEIGIGFNPEMTSRENIIIYGMILGFTKKEIINKITNILKFAELENFENTKIKIFSTGMHARLAFSTAIQINPDIILLDEILSVGDITFQEKSFDAIKKFQNNNKTLIIVSHSIEQIKNLCSRVILLENGKIIDDGLPEKVIQNYENRVKK